jgi:hypothetical protein
MAKARRANQAVDLAGEHSCRRGLKPLATPRTDACRSTVNLAPEVRNGGSLSFGAPVAPSGVSTNLAPEAHLATHRYSGRVTKGGLKLPAPHSVTLPIAPETRHLDQIDNTASVLSVLFWEPADARKC